MRINLPMLGRLLNRAIKGPTDIESAADSIKILCQEEAFLLQPAIHLRGEPEKIKKVSPYRNINTEQLLIRGGKWLSSPIKMFALHNVEFVGPFFYAGALKIKPGYGNEKILLPNTEACKRLEVANLVTTWSGSRWFGSLLLDDFPLELLPEDTENNLRIPTKTFHHENAYRDRLKISTSIFCQRASVNKLRIFNDPTINSHKANRYKILRQRLTPNQQDKKTGSYKHVYLKRGTTGETRILKNERAIELFLQKQGFKTIDTANLDANEIINYTLGAMIVIGIEGSHLSHAIFTMAANGTLVVLQPPDRFAMVYKEFTDCLNMRFAFVVGNDDEEGFSVSTDQIDKVLELVARNHSNLKQI